MVTELKVKIRSKIWQSEKKVQETHTVYAAQKTGLEVTLNERGRV